MNEPAVFLAVFILGISAGMVYFGGLRLSAALAAARPGLLAPAAGFVLRASFAVAAFITAAAAGWIEGLVMGAGFLLARWAIMEDPGRTAGEKERP